MNNENGSERPLGTGTPTVKWDESSMRSSYANVVHATGTREEIAIIFGIHQAWRSDVKEVPVTILDRILLSPYAAKRLSLLLNHVVREYESRYGILNLEPVPTSTDPAITATR
jgi:hypothetical protein